MTAARLFGLGLLTLVCVVVAAQGQAKQDAKAQEIVRVAAQTELKAQSAAEIRTGSTRMSTKG